MLYEIIVQIADIPIENVSLDEALAILHAKRLPSRGTWFVVRPGGLSASQVRQFLVKHAHDDDRILIAEIGGNRRERRADPHTSRARPGASTG